jgi:nitrite reductase/ring-hydroxylating ferredoxin subunit
MAIVLHAGTDFDQIMVRHPRGFEVILVNLAGEIHAYRNRCPHVGVGLDYGDGRCKTGDNELLCAMHGARFTADSGLCIDGQCAGQSLERIAVRVEHGAIVADA